MNPRRLHSDTIFSISTFSLDSAIRRTVFAKRILLSRCRPEQRCPDFTGRDDVRSFDRAQRGPFCEPSLRSRRCETAEIATEGRVRQFTLAATRFYGPYTRFQNRGGLLMNLHP